MSTNSIQRIASTGSPVESVTVANTVAMQSMPIRIPTKAQLRARRIFTSHDLCSLGSGTVFISFRGKGKAASQSRSAWQVHGIGFRTDPTAKFLDYGAKTFEVMKASQKAIVLEQAQAWATEHFGITKWVCDPFGSWQDAAVAKKAGEMIDSGGTIETAEPEGN